MDHYLKTDLGIQALKQRSFQLNARQRQLLLLIGTDDFKILNNGLKQRLATPELIQQLEDLGLIFQNNVNRLEATIIEPNIQIEVPSQTIESINHQKGIDTLTQDYPTEIIQKQNIKEKPTSNITVSEKLVENVQSIKTDTQAIEKIESKSLELTHISFDEIKLKMMSLLQTHCGLLAKQLIMKIQQATSIRDIKLCQMQWITALQESRISPLELNQTMQQINHSLQHLQSS